MTAHPSSSQNSLGSEQNFKLQMSAVTCKSVMVSPTTNFEIQSLHVKTTPCSHSMKIIICAVHIIN